MYLLFFALFTLFFHVCHMLVNGSTWVCVCGKQFSTRKALRAHFKTTRCRHMHTQAVPPPADHLQRAELPDVEMGDSHNLQGNAEPEQHNESIDCEDNSTAIPDLGAAEHEELDVHHIDTWFRKLAADNNWSQATINQVLNSRKDGFQLDKVSYSCAKDIVHHLTAVLPEAERWALC
mmetsp:Transcript_4270/g.9923  ORF Transcript_4270/g.9923 Transcript_4270/m.9923 type:complete len:177 (-) Transcript_4270:519-1049(-)